MCAVWFFFLNSSLQIEASLSPCWAYISTIKPHTSYRDTKMDTFLIFHLPLFKSASCLSFQLGTDYPYNSLKLTNQSGSIFWESLISSFPAELLWRSLSVSIPTLM
jgi:hypothetical protein